MYSFYEDLLEHVDGLEWFDVNQRSLRMKGHTTPVSITEDEFNFIVAHTTISSHMNFLSYDMATAFGVSAMALAQHPLTHVISIDSYIEEQYNDSGAYRGKSDKYADADGFKMAHKIRDAFALRNIDFHCGYSPDDIESIVSQYGGKPIRHAFVDAAHYDENLVADIKAIAPFLSKGGSIVFMHDLHCFSQDTIQECSDILHKKFNKAELEKTYGLGYFL